MVSGKTKGGNVLLFTIRRKKLTEDLMKTLCMKVNIIEAFREGKLLKTSYFNYS